MQVKPNDNKKFWQSVSFIGGKLDGRTFKECEVEKEDGTSMIGWKCEGELFRRVFVPIDFKHPELVE